MWINSILPSIIDTEPNRKAMPGPEFAKWPKPEANRAGDSLPVSDDGRVVHGAAVPVYGTPRQGGCWRRGARGGNGPCPPTTATGGS